MTGYKYKVVVISGAESESASGVESFLNKWAKMGWRVVTMQMFPDETTRVVLERER